MKFAQAYTFDDITLIPRYSDIKSRFSEEINLSTTIFPGLQIPIPILSANMSTVTESEMTKALFGLGGLGIIHRFMSQEQHSEQLIVSPGPKILCLGVDQESKNRLEYCLQNVVLTGILIDIAHGHCKAMEEMIRYVKNATSLPIMAGNVATYDGVLFLANLGVQSIKVGISSGSLCTTRVKTGNGVPQVTAILESIRAISGLKEPPTIIADGGIRNSGDIMKALALGANAIMAGNLFAGCNEAPGNVTFYPTPSKIYHGMASKSSQLLWKRSYTSVEGEEMQVPLKGPVEDIFRDLVSGIRSGFSYQGARSITELQNHAEFYFQTRAGWIEGTPHGKNRI
jgi:IMP dehydrogenase